MRSAIAVVPWFLQRYHFGNRSLFTLTVALCGSAVLILMYNLISTDHRYGVSRSSSSEQRWREHIWYLRTLYGYSVWPRDDDSDDDDDDRIMSQIDFMNAYALEKRNRKLKVILLVGKVNFNNLLAGREQFVRDKCPIEDCWLTKTQSHARYADALVISQFSISSRSHYLPKPRRQIWIAQHWETPVNNWCRIDSRSVRDLINWTASYRHDSTIVFRYGKMIPVVPVNTTVTSGKGILNYAAGKTKLVAWFVSNCNAGNARMRYVRELSQFIQV